MTELPPTDKQEDLKRSSIRQFKMLAYGVIPCGLGIVMVIITGGPLRQQLEASSFFLAGIIFLSIMALPLGWKEWKDKWNLIEHKHRRHYAHLYRTGSSYYNAPPTSPKEKEERRQFLQKELALTSSFEEKFKTEHARQAEEKDRKYIFTNAEYSHVLSEFLDAKALLTRELAEIEKLSRPAEEPRIIVAPAPMATQEQLEETGLERY